MGRLKVEMILTDAQLLAFQAIATDRRATIDRCHDWLIAKGFQISRNAVWHWFRRERAKAVPTTGNNAAYHSSLSRSATKLTGRDLKTLAEIAAIMVRNASKSGKVRTAP